MKRRTVWTTVGSILLAAALLAIQIPAADCTMVGATGRATRDGVTILGKNRDYPVNSGQILHFQPDGEHPAGATTAMQFITIAAARQTWQLLGFKSMDERNRDDRLWRWGVGMGMNRHQVSVANNDGNTWDTFDGPALHDNDITRLILERCRTAREAVDLVDELIARHHSRVPEIYTVADPAEIWIIETTGNRWAAVRVTDGVCVRANRFEITDPDLPDDSDRFRLRRRELIEHARARGQYREENGRFSFRLSYSRDYHGPDNTHYNEMRYRRGMERMRLIEGRVTVEGVAAVLRDHFEDWTFDTADGRAIRPHTPGADPHCAMTGSLLDGAPVRTICYGGTVGSMIAVSQPGAAAGLGGTLWACLHLPCLNAYVPFFPALANRLPAELTRAGGAYEQESLWWRLAAVSRNLEARWAESGQAISRIRAHWAKLERKELKEWREIRRRADALARQGKADKARRLLADFNARCVRRLSRGADQVARWVPGFDAAAPPPAFFERRY